MKAPQHARAFSVLLVLTILFFSCDNSEPLPAPSTGSCNGGGGQFLHSDFNLDGRTRSFITFVPGCLKETPTPLLIFYHGLFAQAEGQAEFTALDRLAEKHGFIVVFADSDTLAGPSNNVKGWELYSDTDLRYTQRVLQMVSSLFSIDLHRIYGCGHSMGGRMAMVAGSELSGTFAAMCAFAPGPIESTSYVYAPTHPMPFAIVQGSADMIVSLPPYNALLTDARDEVRAGNGADQATIFTSIAHGDGADHILYTPSVNLGAQAPLLWYYIDGMGHIAWPTPLSSIPFEAPRDVNELMWEFLSSYQR